MGVLCLGVLMCGGCPICNLFSDENHRAREVADPRTLLEFSVPAALSFVAHFTSIIASILHQPLPYPMGPTALHNSSNLMSLL